jgi:transcriptional regulator with XRE-family HTH domain
MPAKPLSPEQLEDAARLKSKFRMWQAVRAEAGKPWSQEYCSEQLRMGQSAINQYLNGRIPLNLNALLKFAILIDVPIRELSPALADELEMLTKGYLPHSIPAQPLPWPFPAIDREKLQRLDRDSLTRLEGAILLTAKQLELDIRKK